MTTTPTIIEVSEDNLIEAEFMSAGFVDPEIKNRVYINTVGVDTFISYLSANGIITDNLKNIHSIKKVSQYSNIADILLPNVHLDVRVVFDENAIFVPKSHFVTNLIPDAYVVLKYNKYLKSMDYLGYFEPKVIDKEKQNDEYYFVTPDQLESPESVIDFVRNFEKDAYTPLTDDEILKGRELAVKVSDHDFTKEEYKEFLQMLLRSEVLRDAILEFDNFETLASNVVASMDMSEVKFAEDAPKLVDNIDDLLTSFETPEDNSEQEEELLKMLEQEEETKDLQDGDITIEEFLEPSDELSQPSEDLIEPSEDLSVPELENETEDFDDIDSEGSINIDDLEEFGEMDLSEDNLSVELKEEDITLEEDKYFSDEDANGDSMLDDILDAGIKIGGAVLGGAALVAGTKAIAAGAASSQAIELAGVAGEAVKDVAEGVASGVANVAGAVSDAVTGLGGTEKADSVKEAEDTISKAADTSDNAEDLTDFGNGDDLLSETEEPEEKAVVDTEEDFADLDEGEDLLSEPEEPEENAHYAMTVSDFEDNDSASEDNIDTMKNDDDFETFDELDITTDDFEADDMGFDFGDVGESIDENISDFDGDITDVPVEDSQSETDNISDSSDDITDFDTVTEEETAVPDDDIFEEEINNTGETEFAEDEPIVAEGSEAPVEEELEDESLHDEDITDMDMDSSNIENSEIEEAVISDSYTDEADTGLIELTEAPEIAETEIETTEQQTDVEMIDFNTESSNISTENIPEEIPEDELVDLSGFNGQEIQDDVTSAEGSVAESPTEMISFSDVSVAPDEEHDSSEGENYELINFDKNNINSDNEEVNFELADDFSIVTDMPEFADFSNQEIGFAPNEIIITDEFLNNSVVTENSVVISNKTIKAGEIHIDINNKAQEDFTLENDHIDNLYNPSEEITEDAGLNNSVRIANQEQKPKGIPLSVGLGGIALIVAIAGIILFAMTKNQNPNPQVAGPITGEPIPQDNNMENQNPEQGMNNDNLVMNDNPNPIPSAPEPNAGSQVAQQPQPQIQTKQIPATSYLSIKKLTWEVPDYVSFDPNFRQYFQSAGKSVRSALSSDLLLATDYTYSNPIKVAVVFDKTGMFKQSRMVSSSGSTQVDKIVLQSLNQTLKVLKAPKSLRDDDSTTVILKIYL